MQCRQGYCEHSIVTPMLHTPRKQYTPPPPPPEAEAGATREKVSLRLPLVALPPAHLHPHRVVEPRLEPRSAQKTETQTRRQDRRGRPRGRKEASAKRVEEEERAVQERRWQPPAVDALSHRWERRKKIAALLTAARVLCYFLIDR